MSGPVDFAAARAARIENNDEWSVLECLKEAVREVEAGERKADSCLILFHADDDDDGFETGWSASHMRSGKMIWLMEFVKAQLLTRMGAHD